MMQSHCPVMQKAKPDTVILYVLHIFIYYKYEINIYFKIIAFNDHIEVQENKIE